jgi:hypothetical protein
MTVLIHTLHAVNHEQFMQNSNGTTAADDLLEERTGFKL